MSHCGLAMLLWWPREREVEPVYKGGGTRGGRGKGRPEPDLSEDGAQLVEDFEDFLARAQFCLRSKGDEDDETRRVKFTATREAPSLSARLLPKVRNLAVLLSTYTFKLVDENDAATLQTKPHWEL